MATQQAQPRSGSFIVVLLILLGVAAGLLTVTYWSTLVKFIKQSPNGAIADTKWSTDGKAGGQASKYSEIDEAFTALSVTVNEIMKKNDPVPSPTMAEIEQFIQTHPDHAAARTLLGHALVHNDDKESGYAHWVESLKIDPNQSELHLLAGTLALEFDRVDEAENHYRNAVNIDALEPRYHVHLAAIYNRKRQFDKARDSLLRALRLDSTMHEAHERLAQVYARQNKLATALGQIDRAIQHTPETKRAVRVQYIRFKAKLLRRDNRPADALNTLLYGLNRTEQADVRVLEDMANCLAMQGQFEQAAVIYERQMKLQPFVWELAASAAKWRIKAEDFETAKKHIGVIRRLDPQQPVIGQLEKKLK